MRKKNSKHPYPLPTRTVLYSRKKDLEPIPEVGKKYHCFDDGKIRFSRIYFAEVTEVLGQMKFKKKYPQEFKQWIEKSKTHYWLYSRSTDKFVVAKCSENEEEPLGVFVRTKQGGWFGIGSFFNSGVLDVSGKLFNGLIENIDDFDYTEDEKKELIEKWKL